ncbi:MAG: flagellar hook-associated protein 1 FlgK, partial [Maricaulis maris]
AEPHNFTTGTSLSFRVDTVNGKTAGSYTIPMVTGESVGDIITALNDTTSGVGRYVTFALDSDGQLDYTANPGYEGFELALTGDDTSRGTSGVSFSDLFGIGLDARASRAEGFAVDTKIRTDSSRLALGKLDIDAATVVGDYVLSSGDNRGGSALQAALSTPRAFDAAGSLATSTASLGDYTARIAGTIGSRAARAESEAASAATLQATAAQKRADVEGVSLDEELAAMTLYQQSYNAAARMLQAAKEMTDTLMGIV